MNTKQWHDLQVGAALGYPRRGPISVEEQRMVVAEIKRLKAIEAAARVYMKFGGAENLRKLADALKGAGDET